MKYGKTLTTTALVIAVAATARSGWWEPAPTPAAPAGWSGPSSPPAPAPISAPAVSVAAAAAPGGLRDLLEAIDRRTRALAAREAAVETRLAMLQSLEHSVGDALGRLEAGGCAADGGSRLRGGVTKIYENMRAEQAAAILDRLDDDTLRVVFAGMDPRRIGAIMAEMSRQRAVAFTRTLAADAPAAAPPATLARR